MIFVTLFMMVTATALLGADSLRQTGQGNVGRNYSMVLVGGGLDDNNDEIWSTIISLGGGRGVARFGVVSAAAEVR